MQILSELKAQGLISADRLIKQLLLKFARQIRPETQCRSANALLKTQNAFAHRHYSVLRHPRVLI